MVNAIFNCSISVITNSEVFNISIDFNDDDQRNILINDSKIIISKSYSKALNYSVSAKIVKNNFVLQQHIKHIKGKFIFDDYSIFK